ncbi:HAD domain-containing protein [Noviherbaspirillum sp. ST 5-3]|uniref:HAD domain-containing protein n=1 Tax=Noviherbaspirillum sp. ST 5-3 TaxID=3349878 RepID=UPI0039174DA7
MILFLDFDGVLHPETIGALAPGTVRSAGDFSHLHHFEKVMREYAQVEIVISSAWRETNSLETLRGYFAPDIAARIIGVTPVMPASLDARREREIRTWLMEAGRENEPLIAIDDWALLFSENCDFLFWVDPETAFDEAAAEALRQRLQRITSS